MEISKLGLPVWLALRAVCIGTSVVGALRLLVVESARPTDRVMCEAHSGTIFGTDDPLPEAGAAVGAPFRHSAGSGGLVAQLIAVRGGHVSLDSFALGGDERGGWDEVGEEGEAKVYGFAEAAGLFPLGVRLILVAEAHMIGDLL